jgi:hypothetical protein
VNFLIFPPQDKKISSVVLPLAKSALPRDDAALPLGNLIRCVIDRGSDQAFGSV